MAKLRKELGLDSNGVQKTMRAHNFLGDGASMLALNTISGLVGMITYFYTDKVGLAAGIVGTILLISKIIDAFTDLGMGYIVDRTNTKYGKARPWILWMVLPTFISIMALFLIPASASIEVKIAWALLSNLFVTSIVYTAIAVPYGSLLALSTKSVEERGKMGIYRSIFGFIAGMIIAILLIPLSNLLGGEQKAWIILSVIFGAISSVSLLWTFLTTRESNNAFIGTVSDSETKDEKLPFRESIKYLFKNKYWVIMLIVNLLINITYSLSGSTAVYYTKYILGNDNLVAIMGAAGLIPVFFGFGIIGPMIKKYGVCKAAKMGLVLAIVGNVIRGIFPYSFVVALVAGGISTLGTIPMMAVGGVMTTNSIEYGEWKYGKRIIGMTNSASSFGAKIGSGLGAAMIGWLLALGSYNGLLKVQEAPAIRMILMICIYIPLVMYIGAYLLIRKYDLDDKYADIVNDLEQRKHSK